MRTLLTILHAMGQHYTPWQPEEVLNAYRAVSSRKKNVEVHIFSGVQHGYMMRGMPKAFDQQSREFSMMRAVAILGGFRFKEGAKIPARGFVMGRM